MEELPPEVAVIQTNCFKPEQNILLRPWTGIVEGLGNLIRREKISVPNMDPGRLFELFPQMDMSGDREAGLAEIKDLLKFDAIFHTLYTAMETVSEKRKLLFIFEDIQWMDPLSLSLLSSLILHQKSSRFLFLLTAQPFQEKITRSSKLPWPCTTSSGCWIWHLWTGKPSGSLPRIWICQ
mgnify:CR=1 FL=1